jgi:thioredoxin-dependent peroxiredoxin
MLLSVGEKAPDFVALDSKGDTVWLSDFAGKSNVVLIFYPGDKTPGCTKQLCAIRDDYAAFKARAIRVFGVNPASAASHRAFIEERSFPFPLLVDKGQSMAKRYKCNGRLFVKRTVYGIDKSGTIVFAKRGMPSDSEIVAAFVPEAPEAGVKNKQK